MREQKLYLGSQVDKAAEFCTYCPRLCRFTCPVAEVEHRETVTPWGLMRLLEYARNGSVEFDQEVAEIFYHCTGCGACQSVCKHGIDIPRAVWKARSIGEKQNVSPKALDGFIDFFKEEHSPHRAVKELPPRYVEEVFDQESNVAFFPDCETRKYHPELVFELGKALEIVLGRKVHLSTQLGSHGSGCCGFPLSAAGDTDGFIAHAKALEIEHLAFKTVFTDCASFASTAEDDRFGYKVTSPIVYLPLFLAETLTEDHIVQKLILDDTFLHDGCFSTRFLEAEDAIRALLDLISENGFSEFANNRHHSPCCGGASHYHVIDEEYSNQCANHRLDELAEEGGKKIVTAGQTCVKHLGRQGGDILSVLSLVCRAMGIASFESKV